MKVPEEVKPESSTWGLCVRAHFPDAELHHLSSSSLEEGPQTRRRVGFFQATPYWQRHVRVTLTSPKRICLRRSRSIARHTREPKGFSR